jgi:hypothetical protein
MARTRSTFGKIQREQEKKTRARVKQERRAARRDEQPDADPAASTLEQQQMILSELARLRADLAEERITLDTFEERQEELLASLRIE